MSPDAEVTTMRQVRVIVRTAIGTLGLTTAADLVGCSPQTLTRILKGRNVHVLTVVRILDAFGYRLVLSLERAPARNINGLPTAS